MVEGAEGEMVDPLSVTGAKAAQAAAEEVSKAAGNILTRMFGPPADEVGEYLQRKAHYRLNNAERIAEKAQRKAKKAGRETGSVAPRLAYTMLEEGTYSDDELMAEYLGGVLAGGRTPSGKDDRGVTWTKLITSMSVLQLRTHFILYREWALKLHGRTDIDFAMQMSKGHMYVNLEHLLAALIIVDPNTDADSMFTHAFAGLARLNLIADNCNWGPAGEVRGVDPAAVEFQYVLSVYPSLSGVELYGWACGIPGLTPRGFIELTQVTELDADIRRPSVAFPDLSAEGSQ